MVNKFSYCFKNKSLLEKAFTHRSYLNEHKNKNLQSNERLEFLGDAVLELIVSVYLFKKHPYYPEGKLTSLRSKLVQTKTLSLASQRLNFGQNLKLSKGEKALEGQTNPSILADTFEAVVGAIYLDGGFQAAYRFVLKNLLLPAKNDFSQKLPKDYKSHLQETVQAKGFFSPTYKVLATFGPDHNKVFKVAVFINGKKINQGTGKSKQEAEQQAAKKALEKIKKK